MKGIGSICSIVLSLLLVVGLHEMGHAIAATIFGVKIQRISIGFGQALLSWRDKRGIEWVWALWPLGGFVTLLNSRIETVTPDLEGCCFDKKPIWVRSVILISGAGANVLTAWVALILMLVLGYKQTPPVIARVLPVSISAQSGLVAGERIVSIQGQSTSTWQEVSRQLIMGFGQTHLSVVLVDANDHKHHRVLDLSRWHYYSGKRASLLLSLGIRPDVTILNTQYVPGVSVWQASQRSCVMIGQFLWFYLLLLKQLVLGILPFSLLLGPLGMFSIHHLSLK